MNKIKILITALTVLLILQSCSDKKTENAEQTATEQNENLIKVTKEQFEKSEMQTAKPELVTFKTKIRTTGKIILNPKGKAYVNSVFPGVIKRNFVMPGQKVARGQKLCSMTSIDIISLQQEFSETANKLEKLKKDYSRKKSLFDEKVISEKEYQAAKSDYFGMLGNYNGLKQKILMMKLNPDKIKNGQISSEIYLTAPISGYITGHNCVIGQSVSEGDNLFEIIDLSKMQLEFYVFEKDINKVKTGGEIYFFTADNFNEKYKGKIIIIGKSVDRTSKTVKCYAEINTKNIEHLAENMYMNVDITSFENKKPALPEEAVVKSENKNFVLVFVKKDGKNYYFNKEEIKTGNSANGYTEIITNDTSKVYLTKGAYNLITE